MGSFQRPLPMEPHLEAVNSSGETEPALGGRRRLRGIPFFEQPAKSSRNLIAGATEGGLDYPCEGRPNVSDRIGDRLNGMANSVSGHVFDANPHAIGRPASSRANEAKASFDTGVTVYKNPYITPPESLKQGLTKSVVIFV